MSLSPAIIYRRTDRGVREVYEKSHQFTQSERLILILLDGRLNVAGLQARLPSLSEDRIASTLVKLEEGGLVQPTVTPETVRESGPAEVRRLEPEAVAQFLDQTDLDPVTGFAVTEEEAASELMRASVERAATALARESALQESTTAKTASRTIGPVEVGERSQPPTVTYFGRPTETAWEAEATQFAITTVNVPDRLDLQEERDRAEAEEYAAQQRRVMLRILMKRLLGVAVVAVFGVAMYGMLKPLRDDTSPARVAERLEQAFRRPVTVSDTAFHFMPTPRLVVHGVDVNGQFGVEEVSVLINWKDLWAALRGGQWVWGEATVAPLTMTSAQALAAIGAVPVAARNLPSKISTIRFESVQISDSRLFPGRYEGVLRRVDDGSFGPFTLTQLDADGGGMQIQFRPAAAGMGAGVTEFALVAEKWALPVGPRVRWNEVRANGRLQAKLLEVSNFSLAGFFGVTTGTVFAAGDVEWAITGMAGASNIDVESVVVALRPKGKEPKDNAPAPFQGTADLNLAITGRGRTLNEAIAGGSITGPFQVRWATLNGINLGLAATQGATAAGTTRFTEFDGVVIASAAGIRFEESGGRAGALSARADFAVAPDQSLAGGLRIALGGQSIQAPVTLRIRGSVYEPRFGR